MWYEQIPFLAEGGVVMGVLYLVSLLGVGLILERAVALRRSRVAPDEWMTQMEEAVAAGGFADLGRGAGWPDVAAARALRRFLSYEAGDATVARDNAEWLLRREQDRLERGLGALGMLAALAPLLGLLGTVAGMIETFQTIAGVGVGDPKVLAGGIYQALYTTAAGLALAIPFTVGHRGFRTRSRRFLDEIADFLEGLWWSDRQQDVSSDREDPRA